MRTDLDATLGALCGRLDPDADVAIVRDEERTVVAVQPAPIRRGDGAEGLAVLDALDSGWWAGFCAYDLGRAIERVPSVAAAGPAVPDALFARFDASLVLEPGADPRIEGEGPGVDALRRLLSAQPAERPRRRLEEWTSSLDRPAFEAAVGTILDHLRAGDCYQVNLTRQLVCDTAADPFDLFCALAAGNPAPHAALVKIGDVAVVSASPESFIRRDGKRIYTRPIKGTSSDETTLAASIKDRAENVMIVDLARNDLGRICEYGTVHVPALCEIEQHPGLYHFVSTVAGTLRTGLTPGDVIRATFPPASVTGCPKPRVLQIIESLEPVRRGVYCGAVGFIDADSDVIDLNVAIRTFTITGGRTYFGVGGGIVADSRPGAEWDETELKAKRLLELAAG